MSIHFFVRGRTLTTLLLTCSAVLVSSASRVTTSGQQAAGVAPRLTPTLADLERLHRELSDSPYRSIYALPSPDDATKLLTFVFQPLTPPVRSEPLRGVIFARGTTEDQMVSARLVIGFRNTASVTVYLRGAVYGGTLQAGVEMRYDLRVASVDQAGRTCHVTALQDLAGTLRLQAPERIEKDQKRRLHAALPDDPRHFDIAIAIGAAMRQGYNDDARLEYEAGVLIFDADEIWNRDLHVDVSLAGPLHFPTPTQVPCLAQDLACFKALQKYMSPFVKPPQVALGHLIDIGGGGVSDVGTLCAPGFNARALTTVPDPSVPSALVTFVHEVGHQLGAPHSFNIKSDYRHSRGAYEPGLGQSVMSWGSPRDAYFHARSIELVHELLDNGIFTGTCGTVTSTPKPTLPSVSVSATHASAPPGTGIDLDALKDASVSVYRWDEYDRAPLPDHAPPFFPASSEAGMSRSYPRIDWLIAPANAPSYAWPQAGQTMKFRVLGFSKDNIVRYKDVQIEIKGVKPFAITQVGCGVNACTALGTLEVSFKVADTTKPPYNVQTLSAYLFDEATATQRRLLDDKLPNTSPATLTLPADVGQMTHARLLLQANGGVFFALSDRFAIQ